MLAPPATPPVRHGRGRGHRQRAEQDDHDAEPDEKQDRLHDRRDQQQEREDEQQERIDAGRVATPDGGELLLSARGEEVVGEAVRQACESRRHRGRAARHQHHPHQAFQRRVARLAATLDRHPRGGEDERCDGHVHHDPLRLGTDFLCRTTGNQRGYVRGQITEDRDGGAEHGVGDALEDCADRVAEEVEEADDQIRDGISGWTGGHFSLPT